MAKGFEEHDAGCDRDVEGANGASGGNGNEKIAALANQIVEACAFAAHDDGDATFVIHFRVTLLSTLIETDEPKASFLELFHGTRQIFDAGDGQVRECTSGNARYSIRQPRGATFGDDEPSSACRKGRANDCANVVRVLDAVEKNEQVIDGLGVGLRMAGEKIFDVEGFTCGGESHDTLVMFGGRGAI